jgi:hypothetical protein
VPVTHGHTLTVGSGSSVLNNDMNMGPGTMTAVQYSSPAHGTISAFNSDGTFTYVTSGGTSERRALQCPGARDWIDGFPRQHRQRDPMHVPTANVIQPGKYAGHVGVVRGGRFTPSVFNRHQALEVFTAISACRVARRCRLRPIESTGDRKHKGRSSLLIDWHLKELHPFF